MAPHRLGPQCHCTVDHSLLKCRNQFQCQRPSRWWIWNCHQPQWLHNSGYFCSLKDSGDSAGIHRCQLGRPLVAATDLTISPLIVKQNDICQTGFTFVEEFSGHRFTFCVQSCGRLWQSQNIIYNGIWLGHIPYWYDAKTPWSHCPISKTKFQPCQKQP